MAKVQVKQTSSTSTTSIDNTANHTAAFQKNVLTELKSIRKTLENNKNFTASNSLGNFFGNNNKNDLFGATEANRLEKQQKPITDLKKSVDSNFNKLFNILSVKPDTKEETKSNNSFLKTLFKTLWNVIKHPFKTIGTILKWGFKLITTPFKVLFKVAKWGFTLLTSPLKVIGGLLKWGFRFLFHPLKTLKVLGKLLIRGIKGLSILKWIPMLGKGLKVAGKVLGPVAKISAILWVVSKVHDWLIKLANRFKNSKLGRWLGFGNEEPGSAQDKIETRRITQQLSTPTGVAMAQAGKGATALGKLASSRALTAGKYFGKPILSTAGKGLQSAGKVLGPMGALLQVGTGALEYREAKRAGDNKAAQQAVVGTAAGLAGGWGGAAAGAALGTAILPGIGTVIGGLLGGMGGGTLANWLGRKASDYQYDKDHPEERLAADNYINLSTENSNLMSSSNDLYLAQSKRLNAEADAIQQQNNYYNSEMINLLKSIDLKMSPNTLSSFVDSISTPDYSGISEQLDRI